MNNIQKIDHIGIAVRSIDSAMKMYESLFGLTALSIEENKEYKVKLCFIPVGEVMVEFLEPSEAGSPYDRFIREKGETIHHIAYKVSDIDQMIKQLKKAGIKLLDEEAKPGGAGSRVAFIDPSHTNGIMTELVERPGT